jgi:hypothetical protein
MKLERKTSMTKIKTRTNRTLMSLLLVLAATSFCAAQTDAEKSFNQVKSLAGFWEGKSSMNEPLQVSFKVTSGGSAVMSEIAGHGDGMISMIHLDGAGKLLLTHYCSIGNQPRMQASVSPDGKTITFDYFDATNLAAPDAGHMQRMVLTLFDDNHHTELWTFVDHGKEKTQFFDLRRKL